MLLLLGTTDKLQVVTATPVSTIAVHASYVDTNAAGSTITPGRTNTLITAGAPTTSDVVAAPGSGNSRTIKSVSIRNTHASSSELLTVQHTDGSNVVELIKLTLLAGYELHYNEGYGWTLIDTSGGAAGTPLAGRYLGSTMLTSASANFTTGTKTNTIKIRGVGGGGGGAGCTSVASSACGGGGGGAGGYVEKTFAVSPNTAYAYTCGALGAGASGALGGTGGNSTFVVGATTVTALGGTGAPVATAATTLTAYPGGAGGLASTNGDVNGSGEPGQDGYCLIVATPIVCGGAGGSGPFGGGGKAITAAGNGTAATGFGAGGGGACTGAAAVRTGGSGVGGCWIVDEFS